MGDMHHMFKIRNSNLYGPATIGEICKISHYAVLGNPLSPILGDHMSISDLN